MRLLNVNLIVLFAVLFINFSQANAQECGKYYTNIYIQDNLGKPLENAVVQLLPISNDETKGEKFVRNAADPSNFTLGLFEGHDLREFHRLIISADGFKSAENELKTVSCDKVKITVKLARFDSAEEASWIFDNRISLDVSDENGETIEHTNLQIKRKIKSLINIRF